MQTTAAQLSVDWADDAPWFQRRPRRAIGVATCLFLAIVTVRLTVTGPNESISMLYVLPIALVAMAKGRVAGVLGGAAGVGLIGLWVGIVGVHLSLVGWSSRILPLLLVGFLLGDASERLDQAARERQAHRVAAQRQHDAVEINDTLVQGMSVAKWAFEAGRIEAGLRALDETVVLGHRLVSDLIRTSGGADVTADSRSRRSRG